MTSTPTSPSNRSDVTGLVLRSVTTEPSVYGLMSNLRLLRGTSMPTRVAAADTRNSPGPAEMGIRVR